MRHDCAVFIQDIATKEVLQSVDATYTIGQFENELASSLNVYPNPATDRVFVEGDFEGEAHVRMINMLGQEVDAFNGMFQGGQKLEIHTDQLAPGTYMLIVSKEGTTHAEPVVIK